MRKTFAIAFFYYCARRCGYHCTLAGVAIHERLSFFVEIFLPVLLRPSHVCNSYFKSVVGLYKNVKPGTVLMFTYSSKGVPPPQT